MLRKHDRRPGASLNAGSMADIAFLLLIFFLVTTTIVADAGIAVRLPPWVETPPEAIPDRNVLQIKINAQNELFIENEVAQSHQIREITKAFISNPEQLPDYPQSPKKAVVSLVHDRSTHYSTYIQVYNEIAAAYQELWEMAAQDTYGESYAGLGTALQRAIRAEIPFVISEAEPVEYEW